MRRFAVYFGVGKDKYGAAPLLKGDGNTRPFQMTEDEVLVREQPELSLRNRDIVEVDVCGSLLTPTHTDKKEHLSPLPSARIVEKTGKRWRPCALARHNLGKAMQSLLART